MSSQESVLPRSKKTEQDHIATARTALVDAALPHVGFDGWSNITWHAALDDSGIDVGLANQACPRGAVDLALVYHRRGDNAMIAALEGAALSDMRFRDRIAFAVKIRLSLADKEAVRRGMALFALPQHVGDGSKALWGTIDTIWNTLGDTSDDINWYTKRGTLSGVYSATVLFWLGDDSDDHMDTWAFLDRRIENVMQFEKIKSKLADGLIGRGMSALFGQVKRPDATPRDDLPGYCAK